ncbi:MAG TPA: RpiB/LacA/LacB family sugar-phosphate isomerase [Candidatus Paceibacterota bacterium]|nr:RpiB/LacA/LacB family sugar-phosphate isomerase [Candidatus Paceibacterota bacterium]
MVFIGADHRGFKLKEALKDYFDEMGIEHEDMGAFEYDETDDFPQFAKSVAEQIHEPEDRGIVICGSGVGVDEVANKIPGVRAGLAMNREQIKAARHDDDINVLALAADFTSEEDAKAIVKVFLGTEFSGEERHKRRINQIEEIDDFL